MTASSVTPLRPVISWTLIICLAVAMAPWFSGGQEPLALFMSGGALLLGSLLAWRQPEVRRLRRGPLVWAYSGLIGWATLSLLWTANRYSSALWIVGLVVAGLGFRLAYVVAGEPDGRRRLLRTYLVSAVLVCAYGFWLYLTGEYDRFTSSFYWANPAAAYLMPAVLICLDGLRRSGRMRWVYVVLLTIFGVAFALTDSRAATLVLFMAVLAYFIVAKANKRFWITFVFNAVLIILVSNGFTITRHILQPNATVTKPGSRFAEAASGESKSLADRVYYLKSAASMWFDNPVGGVGAGTYGDVHPRYQERVISASTSAHNFYVQTWAELGLVGAILLAWLLLALLLGMVRGLLSSVGDAVPVVLGLLAVFLHIGLDIDARYPAILVLVAVLAGVIYGQRLFDRGQLGWRVPLLAALILAPLISLYQSDVWAQRARVSQDDGNYEQAADQFGQAHRGLVYNPDLINAEGIDYYVMASAGGAQGKTDASLALDRARTAQRLDPADGQHHQLEGRVLELMNQPAAAERAYREALRLDPYNHPDYAYDLAALQLRQNRSDEALRTAQAMAAQYTDAVVTNRSADSTLRSNLANLWSLIGNIALQRDNLVQARAADMRALSIDKQNLRARALRVQLDRR
jgi:O-antigen ligase/Flp pilus assembly protein TadD